MTTSGERPVDVMPPGAAVDNGHVHTCRHPQPVRVPEVIRDRDELIVRFAELLDECRHVVIVSEPDHVAAVENLLGHGCSCSSVVGAPKVRRGDGADTVAAPYSPGATTATLIEATAALRTLVAPNAAALAYIDRLTVEAHRNPASVDIAFVAGYVAAGIGQALAAAEERAS